MKIEQEISTWEKKLNQKLVDSFTIAFIRDQSVRRDNFDLYLLKLNDRKNGNLIKWTIENYGYPSIQKIGIFKRDDTIMPMLTFLSHLAESDYFPYLEETLLQYVKSGDCLPRDYATLIDRNKLKNNLVPIYAEYQGHDEIRDSIKVNMARKSIGLPGLIHRRQITKDFFKKK